MAQDRLPNTGLQSSKPDYFFCLTSGVNCPGAFLSPLCPTCSCVGTVTLRWFPGDLSFSPVMSTISLLAATYATMLWAVRNARLGDMFSYVGTAKSQVGLRHMRTSLKTFKSGRHLAWRLQYFVFFVEQWHKWEKLYVQFLGTILNNTNSKKKTLFSTFINFCLL